MRAFLLSIRSIMLGAFAAAGLSVNCLADSTTQNKRLPAGETVLETRFVVDSSGCPLALEIWLSNPNDTIQGMELGLIWDRPDYARFRLDTSGTTTSGKSTLPEALQSIGRSGRSGLVIDRGNGLLKTWDFVEARGTDGLSAKITALAYVAAASSAKLILPQDTGMLMSLPIELPSSLPLAAAADSTSVGISPVQTRVSDNRGNLVKGLIFRESRIVIANCTARSSGGE